MTLEERKRIVNLALEVNATVSSVKVPCYCYSSGSVSIPISNKETGEGIAHFVIDSSEPADDWKYRGCEAYLKALLKRGGETNENPERQTSEAAAAEPDARRGA